MQFYYPFYTCLCSIAPLFLLYVLNLIFFCENLLQWVWGFGIIIQNFSMGKNSPKRRQFYEKSVY